MNCQGQAATSSRLVGVGALILHDYVDHTRMIEPEGNDFSVTDSD